MSKDLALKLIHLYVEGWRENDVLKIIKPLDQNCEVVESHGPIYKGVETIKKWVAVWLRSKGKVNKWEIISFYFVDNTAIFEWIFDCNVDQKNSVIEGVSIVRFKNEKINYLREYRMTKPSFEWNQKELAD